MAAAVGNPEAEATVRTITGFIGQCAAFPAGSPHAPLCVGCEASFDAGSPIAEAFVLTIPLKGGMASVTPICAHCAARQSDAELANGWLTQMQRIWPDLKVAGNDP
jgi:hypothetical protein